MNQVKKTALVKIGKGSALILFGVGVSNLLGLVKDIILARNLGSSGYGIFSIALSSLMIVGTICLLGFNQGLVYFISTNLKRKLARDSFTLSGFRLPLLISILLASLLFVFRYYISFLFHIPQLSQVLAYFSFTIPFYVILELTTAVARGHQNLIPDTIIKNIGRVFLFLSFALVAIYSGLGIRGVSIAFFFSYLLASIFSYYYIKRYYQFSILRSNRSDYQRKILNYSWPLFLASSLQQIVNKGVFVIAGLFLTSGLVGVLAASQKLAAFVAMPLSILIPIFFPVISQLIGEKKLPDAILIFQNLTKWLILLILPFFTYAFVFSEKILLLVYGSDYSGNSFTFQLLILASFFGLAAGPINNLLMANHWTRLILLNTALAAAVNVGLSLILIPHFGVNGAAIAVLLAVIMGNSLPHLEYYWNEKRFIFPQGAFRCLLIMAILFLVLFLVKYFTPNQLAFPLGLILTVLLDLRLIFSFKLIDRNDYYLIGLVKRRLKILISFHPRDKTG